MGERVQRGAAHSETSGDADFDAARAERVLPLVARLLGLASE